MPTLTTAIANRHALSASELRARAPAVFAEDASSKMGERYTFIPSAVAVEQLSRLGLVPVDASQRASKQDPTHARHLVRFARKADLVGKGTKAALKVGDTLPEIVLSNSHNGRAAYKLLLGAFRVVCGNGLIISDGKMFGLHARHVGDVQDILDQAEEAIGQFPKMIARMAAMRGVMLTDPQRLAFASAALELRYLDESGEKPMLRAPFDPSALLHVRRPDDAHKDLWTTFNVVQENLMRGGLDGKSANGRSVTTRAVNDVRKIVSYNVALWDLAAERLPA